MSEPQAEPKPKFLLEYSTKTEAPTVGCCSKHPARALVENLKEGEE